MYSTVACGAAWKQPASPLWKSHGYVGRRLSVERSRSLTSSRGATTIQPHLPERLSGQKTPRRSLAGRMVGVKVRLAAKGRVTPE
jgi:hypothetical protein